VVYFERTDSGGSEDAGLYRSPSGSGYHTGTAVSLFSPWHSYRLFKELLGVTPAEYIRRLRLSRSAMQLKEEQCLVTK